MRLPAKLLAFVMPAVVVPMLAVGLYAYDALRQTSEEKQLVAMTTLVGQADVMLQTAVREARKDAALIANNNLIRTYMLLEDEDQRLLLLYPTLIRYFGEIQAIVPDYLELRIIFPDGYEEVRRTVGEIPNRSEEERDSPLFRGLKGNAVDQARVLANPDTGRPALYVSRPLAFRSTYEGIRARPRLRGYLVLTVSLRKLETFVQRSRLGRDGYLLAVDGSGTNLFPAARRPMALPADLHFDSDGRADDGNNLYLRSGRNGLADFVAVLPRAELNTVSTRLAVLVGLVTVLTTILLGALVYLLMRGLVIAPIRQLRAMAGRIGTGQLDVAWQGKSRDEFQELGRSMEDMAARLRESGERIRTIAFRDSLTGLANRALFTRYLERVAARARRDGSRFALMFIDIDDFKTVNDTRGHDVGDALLQQIADRIAGHVRGGDMLAMEGGIGLSDDSANLLSRLGGDEFTLILPNLPDPAVAGTIARRLVASLAEPFVVEGEKLLVSASVGITVYPDDSRSTSDLLKFADIAMYQAKEAGKNNYRFFHSSMNEQILRRTHIESRLREAADNGSLRLMFQPQVALASGAVVGVESLLRWNDRELGAIDPGVFIPLAESSGAILAIGEWVIRAACRQAAAWQAAGLALHVAVNVSNVQFQRQDVPGVLQRALREHGLPASAIAVEITESTTMSTLAESQRKLAAVHDQGVSIALDDFGTGYSSLSQLLRFSIDTLKIDRAFVRDLLRSEASRALVSTIIMMAHNLGMKVVAEGVEEAAQVDVLAELGCDMVQGYYFSPPVEADAVLPLVERLSGTSHPAAGSG